jgi:hypothetical protein
MPKTKLDVHTRAGRDEIDRRVKAALRKGGQARGSIASRVGIPERAASSSLARGLRDGWARFEGERSQRVWFAVGGKS